MNRRQAKKKLIKEYGIRTLRGTSPRNAKLFKTELEKLDSLKDIVAYLDGITINNEQGSGTAESEDK